MHTQPSEPPAARHHTVAPGDTLWDIAVAHGRTVTCAEPIYEIQQLNGLSSAEIYPGQVLFVPTDMR